MSGRATMTSRSLTELVFLSDPACSADGRRAFCVRTRIHQPADAPPSYRSQVCELPQDGGEPLHVLAEGPNGSDAPRPSPTGDRLAFLSRREGDDRAQVHLLDLERGGDARKLTRLAGGVRELVWHPDGTALAGIGSDAEPPAEGDAVVARTVQRLQGKREGLPWPGVREAAPAALWRVPLDGGEATVLAELPDGVDEAVWAPDGTLWLLGPADADEADAGRTTLWRLRTGADGGPDGRPQPLVGGLLMASSLAVSQDGSTLAWLAPGRQDAPSSVESLWTLPASGGTPQRVSGDVAAAPEMGGDARHGSMPNRPVHTPGGWMVNANVAGASSPARVQSDGSVDPLLAGGRVTVAFTHAAGRTLALVETPSRPGELVRIDADGDAQPLTDENGAFNHRYRLREPGNERRAPNGDAGVPWWRLDPAEPRADGAIVVQVHGGPRTNVGYGFSFEFQLLAANGYSVVTLNPRGSSSYGDAYGAAIVGGYGGVDADDVLSVVDDAARAGPGRQDPPVHLTGGSYGGFMTNLLVTRTDRFRSAVTQRSICNWLSFYGTSDIGYRFAEHETGGTPWANAEHLWRQSPLAQVERVTTPILVLHADADHRCPVEQAEQWFVALKRIGRAETRLVRFADEGHELSRSGRPDRRIRRLDEIVGWFQAHP